MKYPVQQALRASGVVETVRESGGEVVLSKMEVFGRRVEKLVSNTTVKFCRSARR